MRRDLRARMAEAVANSEQRDRLRKAIAHALEARADRVAERPDWEDLCDAAAWARRDALARLPALLAQFEREAAARGAVVHWARNAREAVRLVRRIIGDEPGVLAKSKSMVTEEIGLRDALEGGPVRVVETDLGEYIVQIAGELPSHIVAPVIHKSAGDIATLFRERLGMDLPSDADARTISLAAREHLRSVFLEATVGMCGANFLAAREGAVVVCTNEGNAALCTSIPGRLVAVTGIEKVLPDLASAAAPLLLLAASATGQRQTGYTHVVQGVRADDEPSGPSRLDIVLVDNGRSRMLRDPELWEALACIRCGACIMACPAYARVGGQAYGWVYPGPVGIVLGAYVGERPGVALASACSQCGACAEVCPVRIDLPRLIRTVRARSHRFADAVAGTAAGRAAWFPSVWRVAGRAVRSALRHRRKARRGPMARWSLGRELPDAPARTFHELWSDEGGTDEPER